MSAIENLPALPTSLIIEIFSNLPAKSVAKYRSLSKQWASTLALGCPYFTELFLSRSTTRPRLLFTVRKNVNDWCLYSCPQPEIWYKNSNSSLSVTAEFHMYLPKRWILDMSPSVSSLIYFSDMFLLCNPSTRHHLRLPDLTVPVRMVGSYFGYDPINKQFSVLAISRPLDSPGDLPSIYQILKIGSGILSWRSLNCPTDHKPLQVNTCINGILYYIAMSPYSSIACFDLNSEEFKFIDEPWPSLPKLLVNFKGKLGGINTKWIDSGENKSNLELSLWVLEDVEKQEWSKQVHMLPSTLWNEELKPYYIIGLTATCDVVLALRYTTSPFYVYFFNLKNNTLHKVEIKGFEGLFKGQSFHSCVDYVEDLKGLSWS